MKRYRKTAGLETRRGKRATRKETLWAMIKKAFSYERNTGIVDVSTIPFVTERWREGTREIVAFMVMLPRWVSEKEILEAINSGFGFLAEKD